MEELEKLINELLEQEYEKGYKDGSLSVRAEDEIRIGYTTGYNTALEAFKEQILYNVSLSDIQRTVIEQVCERLKKVRWSDGTHN